MDYPCFQYVAEDNFQGLLELSNELYMMCLFADTDIIK